MALDILDGALLDAVRSVRWPARKRAPAGLYGGHLSRARGLSQEFTEYRAYRQGDDTHRIDWKLFSRVDRAYIKLSNERTLLPTTVLIDASGSMAYPSDSLEKWHHARHISIGLAAAAHQGGDPIGLMIPRSSGHSLDRLPPRTRHGVVEEIARVLRAASPTGQIELAPALSQLRHSGRIVVISDFLGDVDPLLNVAALLAAAGKEIYAVHIVHVDEVTPPAREAVFTDPEDPGLRRAMTARTRQQYIENFSTWCAELARRWLASGAYYRRIDTSQPASSAVRSITAGPEDAK